MIAVHAVEPSGVGPGLALDHVPARDAGDGPGWLWFDVQDPTVQELTALQARLGLHPLAVDDARHRGQRPKLDLFDDHVFAVFRPMGIDPAGDLVEMEIHIFSSPSWLLTVRFTPAFDMRPATARWKGRVGDDGSVGALYVLVDEVADGYLLVVDRLEDTTDDLEDQVFGRGAVGDDATQLQNRLLRLRREVVRLRRFAMPTRQAIDLLLDDDRVPAPLVPYFRDVAEHLLRCVELTESVRESLTTILEVRTAQSANELNEVMKQLSAWAGIILVPTLIAGIYGMNFDAIPELRWSIGYPMALLSMAAASGGLYLIFKRRGWL